MINELNITNERFYTARELKNHFEVVVNYIQFGETKHTHKKSVCNGRKLLGMKAYDVKNPDYVTEEVWNNLICKNASQRLEVITMTEHIWE